MRERCPTSAQPYSHGVLGLASRPAATCDGGGIAAKASRSVRREVPSLRMNPLPSKVAGFIFCSCTRLCALHLSLSSWMFLVLIAIGDWPLSWFSVCPSLAPLLRRHSPVGVSIKLFSGWSFLRFHHSPSGFPSLGRRWMVVGGGAQMCCERCYH